MVKQFVSIRHRYMSQRIFSRNPLFLFESRFSRSKDEQQMHLQDLRHVIAHERRLSMRQRLGLSNKHPERFRMWFFLHGSENNLINCSRESRYQGGFFVLAIITLIFQSSLFHEEIKPSGA